MFRLLGNLLIYYLAATMTLSLIGQVSKKARFFSRLLSCYFLLMTCAAYGVLASVVLRLAGRKSLAQWATARAFKTVVCPAVGVEFKVIGEEKLNTRPAVFMSNHQAELDLIILGKVFPKHCSVTAKRSLKYIPFLGWFMSLSGAIFIDRGNRTSAIAAFDAAIEEMNEQKQSVFIFPEGTRSYLAKPGLLPFKKGAFHLAVQAGVPIVPIVVGNYAHILHLKSLSFESGTIEIRVLDPIPTKGLTSADVDELTVRVRELMLKEILAIGGGIDEKPKLK
ncbi:hypothetical protein DFH27DRAFT_481915 [Peziza echinospora]|nr:hypothetical protein DFH27DRAFT_481915 [Peziza echinospora]